MEEDIFNYVKNNQHVSMVELCREIPGFKGDRVWYLGSNTIIWNDCSDVGVEAMNSLLKNQKIVGVKVSPFVYVVDGIVPRYPIAKNSTFDYKKPHWLPVTFSTPDQCRRDGLK